MCWVQKEEEIGEREKYKETLFNYCPKVMFCSSYNMNGKMRIRCNHILYEICPQVALM